MPQKTLLYTIDSPCGQMPSIAALIRGESEIDHDTIRVTDYVLIGDDCRYTTIITHIEGKRKPVPIDMFPFGRKASIRAVT